MSSAAYRPDRGYAWTIVGACFVLSFIMPGMALAIGQLYIAIAAEYGVTKEVASTPFTVRFCVRSLLGAVAGGLGQRFGIRPVVLAGGIVAWVGGIICAVAPDVTWITVGWGGLHGLGYALSHVIHLLMILKYFNKYKALATGISLSGDIAAAFLLPPLIEFLLRVYDIRGTFLVLAAISLHIVPAAMLLVPPAWERSENKDFCTQKKDNQELAPKGISNKGFEDESSLKPHHVFGSSIPKISAGIVAECYFSSLNQLSDVTSKCNSNLEACNNTDIICYKLEDLNSKKRTTEAPGAIQQNEGILYEESRRNISFSTHDMNRLNNQISSSVEKTSTISDGRKQLEVSTRDTLEVSAQTEKNLCNSHFSGSDDIQRQIHHNAMSSLCGKTYFDSKDKLTTTDNLTNILPMVKVRPNVLIQFLQINKKPMYILIGASMSAYYVFFVTVFTVLIDYTIDCNMPSGSGNFLIIAYAVADGLGRLALAVVMDKHWLTIAHFAGLTTGLMGLFVFIMPFWPDFAFWVVSFSVSGFIQGGCAVMYPILVEHYMEKDEQAIALGSLNLYGGLLMLPIPAMIGCFKDTMGSYDGVFWTVSGLCTIIGCLWLLEPCLLRYKQSGSESANKSDSGEKI